MATNVAIDTILDAMVTQLGQLVNTGGAQTTLKPVRTVQRYLGTEFTTAEGLKRGIAGRSPALRVRWAGTKTLRTTIGRRVDRVESTFNVIVASDNHHDKDARKAVLALAETVRSLIGSRAFGLPMTPARYRSTDTLRDDEQLMALSVVFAIRHRVDYTIAPGSDTMVDSKGSIINAAVAHTSTPHAPTVTPQGTPGATSWGYAIVGADSLGLLTITSPVGVTAVGAATLNGVNFNRITFPAMAGIVSYKVVRTTAGGTPNTVGKIGTTSALTFDDTGIAATSTPIDSLHVDLHEIFP